MEEKELTISLRDIFNVLKKNLAFILVVVIVFSACSFFITKMFITKKYTSSISLYVDTTYNKIDNYNSADDLNSYNYAQKLVATYIRMLDTNSFFTEVAKEMDNKYSASQLNGMVTFSSSDETEIFDVSVVSDSPQEAKSVADAVAKVAPHVISDLNDNATLKIVDEAVLPQGYSSPNLSKNVSIAFVIGLLFALLIVFLKEYFDVKIKYNRQMTTLCGVPILASIPDFENYIDSDSYSAVNHAK